MSKKTRKLIVSFLLGIAALAIAYAFSLTGVSRSFERYTYDYRFLLRGSRNANPAVVLIGIDDRCVEQLGKGCWQNRAYHAHMLEYLSKFSPRFIGFDILFTAHETSPEGRKLDEELCRVVDYFDSNTVCMAYNFVFQEEEHEKATGDEIELLKRFELKNVEQRISNVEFFFTSKFYIPQFIIRYSLLSLSAPCALFIFIQHASCYNDPVYLRCPFIDTCDPCVPVKTFHWIGF